MAQCTIWSRLSFRSVRAALRKNKLYILDYEAHTMRVQTTKKLRNNNV